MAQLFNKTTLSEALCIFDFESGCEITKKIIMDKFRKLSLQHHPDKGGDAKIFAKVVDAKEVLMWDFDSIATTTPDANGKPINSVGSVFVDWLKAKDFSSVNPFTIYQQGKSNSKKK